MDKIFDATPQHSMGTACEQTGLTPDVIRAWERRYKAVSPERTDGNQRAFSDQDVYRLKLLRQATRVGRSISKVAHLTDGELVELVSQDRARLSNRPQLVPRTELSSRMSILLQRCLEAVERLDAGAFERQLELAVVQLGWTRTLDEVLVPLMRQVGELEDHDSQLGVHERFAASLVRSFVGSMQRTYVAEPSAPGVVVAAPAGQYQELDAVLVAATAAAEGWKVSYLGADVPTDDIAMAVLETEFDVIALSLTHPRDDEALPSELARLRRLLGDRRSLLVGGPATDAYSEVLDDVGAVRLGGPAELRELLGRLRDQLADLEGSVFHPLAQRRPLAQVRPLAQDRGVGRDLTSQSRRPPVVDQLGS